MVEDERIKARIIGKLPSFIQGNMKKRMPKKRAKFRQRTTDENRIS